MIDSETKKVRAYIGDFFVGALVLLFVTVHLLLIYKNFFIDGQGNFHTAIAGIGDIPFHLTQVANFAFRRFNLNDPIYAGTKLQYSFLVNLISGWLLRATGAWVFSFNAPVVLFAAVADVLAFYIYRRLLGSSWQALFSFFLFFLGGGFGAYSLIRQQFFVDHHTVAQFFSYVTSNNVSTILRWGAVYPQQNITWGSPLILVLLQQRSFIAGFFLFTIVLWLLMSLKRINSTWGLIGIGVLVGLGRFVHIHTFVVLVGHWNSGH